MRLRNGKKTAGDPVSEVKTMCKHTCELSQPHLCCACSDRRPKQATYIAHNQSNMSDVSYVERNHYYCPTCKAKPTLKIDFSNMKKKPATVGFVFPKSTEQKLAEAEAKIAQLEEALKKKDRELASAVYGMELMSRKTREESNAIKELKAENEALKKKCKDNDKELLDYMNEKTARIAELLGENMELKKRVETLTERIRNPMLGAIPSRPF